MNNDIYQNEIATLMKEADLLHKEEKFSDAFDNYNTIKSILTDEDDLNRITILWMQMDCLFHTGNWEGLEAKPEHVLEIIEKFSDPYEKALILFNIGVLYSEKEGIDDAIEVLEECVIILKNIKKNIEVTGKDKGSNIKYDSLMVKCLNEIGMIYIEDENFDSAEIYLEKCLELSKKIEDPILQAFTLTNLGNINHDKENYQQALQYYNQSLEISKENNYQSGIGFCLQNIGTTYKIIDELTKALQFLEESYKILKKTKDKEAIISILEDLGIIYEEVKDYEKSLKMFKKAHQISKVLKNSEYIQSTKNYINRLKKIIKENLQNNKNTKYNNKNQKY